VSGSPGSTRPQWQDVRSHLRPGDTLVVTKLDRMGRDMRETMETAWSLQDLGAKLEILTGPLAGVYDPRGMGKVFFAMLAGFAELEREMMIERTLGGLAQATAEGRHGGRPPVISKDMMRIALGRRADGESVTSIAKNLTYKTAAGEQRTVSRRALYNAFKAHNAERAETL
jgi:DNA invertase Pin-like site-specific DNA recombinase